MSIEGKSELDAVQASDEVTFNLSEIIYVASDRSVTGLALEFLRIDAMEALGLMCSGYVLTCKKRCQPLVQPRTQLTT